MSEHRNNSPVRLALVGLGDHILRRLYPLLAGMSVKLVAACDLNRERQLRFAEFYAVPKLYTNYREMFEQESIDAVLCAGNAQLHYEVAKTCMLKGISPFVEKTPCVSLAQAEELLELQHQTGCFTMVGFNRRFATSYQMAHEIILQQSFGQPLTYMAKYNSSAYSSESYFLLNHVIHHLDLARYFLGEIDSIKVDRIGLNDRQVGYHLTFVSRNGTQGFIQSASTQQETFPSERVEFTSLGQNVMIDNVKGLEHHRAADPLNQPMFRLDENQNALCWLPNHGHSSLYGHYGFERELAVYLTAIQQGTRPDSTFEEVTGTIKLYEQVVQTIRQQGAEI